MWVGMDSGVLCGIDYGCVECEAWRGVGLNLGVLIRDCVYCEKRDEEGQMCVSNGHNEGRKGRKGEKERSGPGEAHRVRASQQGECLGGAGLL
jgi:hypothetical protein